MTSILVTGTNQGIGFGIVEQLAKRPDVAHVFATVRDPTGASSTELRNYASTSSKVHVIKLELNEASAAVILPISTC
jgi:NAD(P)-dependent dehydrogenase (short-subunit alcohol dehydrogenase family)